MFSSLDVLPQHRLKTREPSDLSKPTAEMNFPLLGYFLQGFSHDDQKLAYTIYVEISF